MIVSVNRPPLHAHLLICEPTPLYAIAMSTSNHTVLSCYLSHVQYTVHCRLYSDDTDRQLACYYPRTSIDYTKQCVRAIDQLSSPIIALS